MKAIKKIPLIILLLLATSAAFGQASFTGEYTNNFDSYSSLATLPTGWTTGGSGSFVGVATGSGTTGGFYAFYPSSTPSDHCLGALHSGSATGFYQASFTNNTGSTITSLWISYDFEQYRLAGNTTGWDAQFNGVANAALSAAGVTSGALPYVLTKTTTITGLSIAAGASFTLKWTVNDASGSDNPVGVDNFKMCVPGKAFTVTPASTSPVTEPAPLTFSNTTGGTSPYTYSWSGPAFSSTASGPTISPSAVSNSGTYTLTVTDAIGCSGSGTTTVTVNPGAACSGTPASSTAIVTPAAFCVSGSSTVTVTGGTAASGLTYQWLSSNTGTPGSFTSISGATNVIYVTPPVTTTTYYRLVTTCTSTSASDTSVMDTLTINPLPAITATPSGGSICSGGAGLAMTAAGAASYTWSPAAGLSATTGVTVTANPTVTTTYTITGTSAAGCSGNTTATVNFNLSPNALSITPSSASVCMGTPQLLSATGGIVGPSTYNSGSVTIPASIGALGTITTSLNVASIPTGAVITGASVNVVSFGSQYQDDYIINIKAPNGNILNLVKQRGTHTSTVTTLFSNTNVSSSGTALLSTGSGAFTGTWAADAQNAVGASPYVSNVTNWSSLFSTPNGTWTLSIYNNTTFANVVTPAMQWSITLNYAYQPVTWSPTTDLYTDAAGTVPYTGGIAGSVYMNPSATGVTGYSAIATNATCSSNTATTTLTVNPSPSAISGTASVCQGLTTTLTNTVSGGTWSSSNPAVGTIDAGGVVTGITGGTTTISYTLTGGCAATAIVTVNAAAITGTLSVCETMTTTLTGSATGGTWSSSGSSIASIDASGVVTGAGSGTASITYTTGTGCIAVAEATVDPQPAAITGTLTVCEASTTTLANATTGGTWNAIPASVATIDAAGIVTGVSGSTADITYTLPTGCFVTAVATVNALPDPVTGTMEVCVASTTTLTETTSGGTWSSSATGIATVDVSGVAAGVADGTASISYTSGAGCAVIVTITVHALPSAITGTLNVCEGLTTTLSSTPTGGTWASSAPAVGTIDAAGLVTAVLAGTTNITYTLPTGCVAATIVTVNALPDAITGTLTVCEGSATTLSNTTTGGTWSSGVTGTAAINAAGEVSGVAAGTAGITYTLSTGCIATAIATVYPTPAAISGTLSICDGAITTLANTLTGGSWSSINTGVATIDATSGELTSVAVGTSTISYTMPGTGCTASAVATVNALPVSISGTLTVCEGFTTSLNNATIGGSWSVNPTSVATINATGVLTGVVNGTATVTYTLPAGCTAIEVVTVNQSPSIIGGTASVCAGLTTSLTNTITGGTWNSSDMSVATIDASGLVNGLLAGTTNIVYTLANGCSASQSVTVNSLPGSITGTLAICEGSTTALSSTPAGGTWTSSNANASVSSTGVVTGVTAGTASVIYTLPTGCLTEATVTVNFSPANITGTASICQGAATTLHNTVTGGTWSTASANATVDASSGIVNGVTAGTAMITYTVSSGCTATYTVTVSILPASITGTLAVCQGLSTALGSTPAGGTWSASNTNASVTSAGVVTGVTAGTTGITYALPTGCAITAIVTVNAAPANITGTGSVCMGSTTGLNDAVGGGTWSTSSANATVDALAGIVTGVTVGTAEITYTLSSGCAATYIVTVNSLPDPIAGTLTVCEGQTTGLSSTTAGGSWFADNTNTTITTTGVVSGVAAGTTGITYTAPTGCATTTIVTVNASPSAITGTASVCQGATTTLINTSTGGTWASGGTEATIDVATGVVTGVTAGTASITYTASNGCITITIATVNALPGAITGATTVCEASTTTLTNTGGGIWLSGNSNVTIGSSSGVVTGITAGTSDITYTLPTGCATTTIVTVNALPSAIGGTMQVCEAAATTLTSIGGGTWTSSSANATVGSASGIATGVTAGTAIISYTLSTGCYTTAVATINALPTAFAVTGGGSYCAGGTGVHIGLGNSTTGVSYQLYSGTTAVGSPVAGTGSALDFGLFTATAVYTVSAINTTTTCTNNMTGFAGITVNPVVTPSVSISSSVTTFCSASTATFTATSTDGGSSPAYQWTVNGVMAGTSASYAYTPTNGDIISVKLTSNAICAIPDSAIDADTLTVLTTGMPTVTVAVSPATHVCDGTTVSFAASETFGGTVPSYNWNRNGVSVGTGSTYSYVPANGDVISCVLYSNYACKLADSVTGENDTMIVDPAIAPIVTISANPGLTIAPAQTVTFTATVSGSGTTFSYQWSVNGSAVTGATNATYTTSTLANNDAVTCTVTGSGICALSSFNTVTVRVVVGVTDVDNINLHLAAVPNPNNGTFTITGSWPTDESVTLELTNTLGQVVYKANATPSTRELNQGIIVPHELPGGIYILSARSASTNQSLRIVIER